MSPKSVKSWSCDCDADSPDRCVCPTVRREGEPLVYKNRRCRNAEPHESHRWRGLNTRGWYWCAGRVKPWAIDLNAPTMSGRVADPKEEK